jgi:hypothetical protein
MVPSFSGATLPGENMRFTFACCSAVMSFLDPADKLSASRISDVWYEAGTEPATWQHQVDALARAAYDPIDFAAAPGVHYLVCRALIDFRHELQTLQEDELFTRHVPHLFGSIGRRYSQQFPLLLLLLHSPAFLSHRVDSAQLRDGFEAVPRWCMLLATFLRFYRIAPEPAMVPCMIALYKWAASASNRLPFHKMMLASAALLLRCSSVPLSTANLLAILSITSELELKFVSEANNSTNYVQMPTTFALTDTDERLIYSVFAMLLEREEVREATLARVVRSGEGGVMEVAAAKVRMDRMAVAQEAAAEQRERSSAWLVEAVKRKAGGVSLSFDNA